GARVDPGRGARTERGGEAVDVGAADREVGNTPATLGEAVGMEVGVAEARERGHGEWVRHQVGMKRVAGLGREAIDLAVRARGRVAAAEAGEADRAGGIEAVDAEAGDRTRVPVALAVAAIGGDRVALDRARARLVVEGDAGVGIVESG